MERIKVLSAIRSEDIEFPDDFDQNVMMQHTNLIRWMLNHDPTKRPNTQELLQSDFLPPPLVEEAEMKEMVRHTLSNTQSKAYKHLIDSCMAQKMSLAQEISYDMEVTKDATRPSAKKGLEKTLILQESLRRIIQQIFQRHGAIHVQLGNLQPKGKREIYDRIDLVQVMTRGGGVVSLPYDLRIPFARFLARAQIDSMRRYCIAPVGIISLFISNFMHFIITVCIAGVS